MTKTKSTKRALLMSGLALLMCVSMLIGSTFAWFTDSVTSGNNIIKSGNLDIELEYWNGTAWTDVKGASDILTNTLWEPGVTEVAYLRVANAGSLVLKYQLGINILNEIEGKNQAGDPFKLSDYIQFGVVEGVNGETGAYDKDDAGRAAAIKAVTDAKKISAGYTKAATMNPNDKLYLALVVYMPTTVDNVANHNGTDIPEIDLGINVYATQMTAESDSFNDQYDVRAFIQVTPENFEQTLADLNDGDQLYLQAGTYTVSANEKLKIVKDNVTIIGAGVNSTIIDAKDKTCSGQAALIIDGDNVTLANLTVKTASTDGNVAAIKVANLRESPRIIQGGVIENVVVYGSKGHGINLHGVDGVTVKAVDVRSFGKCAISCAMATNVTVSGTKTAVGGWGADLGVMYGSGDAYATPSNITIKDDNSFGNGAVYTERPATAAGGADTLVFENTAAWAKTTNGDKTLYLAAVASIGNIGYATLQDAIDNAQAGNNTIKLNSGTEYNEPININRDVVIEGAGADETIITNKISVNANVVLKNIGMKIAMTTEEQPAPIATNGQDLTLENCVITRTTQTAQAYAVLVDVKEGKLTAKNTVFNAPYNPDTAFEHSPSVITARGGLYLDGCTIATDGYGLFAQHVTSGYVKNTKFTGIDGRPTLGVFNSTIMDDMVFDGCIFEMGLNSTITAGKFTVKNSTFDFTNTPDDGAGSGLNIYNVVDDIVLENNTFLLKDGKRGINLISADWAPGTRDASKITIKGNEFIGSGYCAIRVSSSWENRPTADQLTADNVLNGNSLILGQ